MGQNIDILRRTLADAFDTPAEVLAAGLTLAQAPSRLAEIGRDPERRCRVRAGPTPARNMGIAERSAGDTLNRLPERADAALAA